MKDTIDKKRIGLLIPHLAKGGAGRAVSRISVLLAKYFDVYLILFSSKHIDFEYSGTIIDLELASREESLVRKIWRTRKRIKGVKKIKKSYNLDVVISFLDITNICNIMSKSKNCKTIVSVRGYIFSYKDDGITAWLKSRVLIKSYKRADRIIAVSKLLRKNIIDVCKIKPEKVLAIYNPFDIQKINEQGLQKLDKEELEFLHGNKIILSAGQLVFQKGYWHLIKAFSLIKYSNVKLLICGEGHQHDDIIKLIEDLKLSDKVKLIGFQENIFKYMKIADVFVLSSITEGFPNVLVEAMACGTAVIAADCASGPREILIEEPIITDTALDIERADYGILVPKMTHIQNWDPAHFEECQVILAKAIDLMLTCEPLRNKYSKDARERAGAFTNEICADKYRETIDQTL